MAKFDKTTTYKFMEPKYEMLKRKAQWKSLNAPKERQLMIPLEAQPEVVQGLVTISCYNQLSKILNLPPISTSVESQISSVDTIIPYIPTDEDSLVPKFRKSTAQETKLPSLSTSTVSESISSYLSDFDQPLLLGAKNSRAKLSSSKTEASSSSEWCSKPRSDLVEVEKKIPYKEALILKHKAVMKFLELPEEEVATWRKREIQVKELGEMNLEAKGKHLIDKVAVEFCDWMRNLGGDEKSSMSEEILKELFEIGMNNPATRGICVKMRENKVLYYKLAEFLEEPDKCFPAVLANHLQWDAKVEKMLSKMVAFGKHLPKDLYFKTPKNKTAETWLEWNKLSKDEINFADVYEPIKDLKSTQEYCKWMLTHPEHKKPKYLVNIGLFERVARGTEDSRKRPSLRYSEESEIRKSRLSSTVPARSLVGSNIGRIFYTKEKRKTQLRNTVAKSQVYE